EVVAARAAELQHTARGEIRRLEAEEPAERREAIRVRLRKRLVEVRQLVVTGRRSGIGHAWILGSVTCETGMRNDKRTSGAGYNTSANTKIPTIANTMATFVAVPSRSPIHVATPTFPARR